MVIWFVQKTKASTLCKHMDVLVCTLKHETSLGNLLVNIARNGFDYSILITICLVQFRATFIEGERYEMLAHSQYESMFSRTALVS